MENQQLTHDGFVRRQLWGGAVQAEIPASLLDVSDMRQVPDHQECFLAVDPTTRETGQLLVFEILERQASVEDSEAAFFYFQDLAESNGASEDASSSFIPLVVAPPFTSSSIMRDTINTARAIPCLGVGFQRIRMGRVFDLSGNLRQGQEELLIKLEVGVLRLPVHHTDLLVTLSTPIRDGEGDPQPNQMGETFRRVFDSLAIVDWTLFGSERELPQ